MEQFELVYPGAEHLPSYIRALEQGWSPDNLRPEAAGEQLAEIRRDPVAFITRQEDREGKGPRVKLPDGREVPRLPGFVKWMWDGEFCGSIGLRWQPGTPELPPYCLGHMGYAVVPWKRRKGYATEALRLMLPEARQVGLPYVELTTDADNVASRRVIEASGGVLVEEFYKPDGYGGAASLRYRIDLS
jgi:predicted acetyltransferase